MDQIRSTLLVYAEQLYQLSKSTKDADDRPKYEQRLAALVPIFIEVLKSGSQEKIKKLVQAEIRREGLDFFPKDKVAAYQLSMVRQPFFNLFKSD